MKATLLRYAETHMLPDDLQAFANALAKAHGGLEPSGLEEGQTPHQQLRCVLYEHVTVARAREYFDVLKERRDSGQPLVRRSI
jgi:hypothetical protein